MKLVIVSPPNRKVGWSGGVVVVVTVLFARESK